MWETLLDIRSAVLKAIEPHRAGGLIKQSLEAHVEFSITSDLAHYDLVKKFIESLPSDEAQEFWRNFFVVSQVTLKNPLHPSDFAKASTDRSTNAQDERKESLVVSAAETGVSNHESNLKGLFIKITHAEGIKCPRCWRWEKTNNPAGLDKRCASLV